jgi:hypothetical protein
MKRISELSPQYSYRLNTKYTHIILDEKGNEISRNQKYQLENVSSISTNTKYHSKRKKIPKRIKRFMRWFRRR